MHKNSLIGAAFTAMLVGSQGFVISNNNQRIKNPKNGIFIASSPESEAEKTTDSISEIISRVNSYIEKLHPQLKEGLKDIEEYHRGMLSENDALMGTQLEGEPNKIIDQFKQDMKNMPKEERDIVFGYLGAIDLK